MTWNFKCKCRLDASVCKERWNDDKCRCECKELTDKGVCDKGYIWNPSNCECECDKSCHVGEYLDYKNCKHRKKLVNKLVEECNEIIEEVKIVKIRINAVLAYCTLCCFQYYLMQKLLLILFTTDTWIIIKKMLLNMTSIKEKIININGRSQTNMKKITWKLNLILMITCH